MICDFWNACKRADFQLFTIQYLYKYTLWKVLDIKLNKSDITNGETASIFVKEKENTQYLTDREVIDFNFNSSSSHGYP